MQVKIPLVLSAAGALLALLAAAGLGGQGTPATGGNAARGQYLVTQVSLCQDCHSPRDEKGAFVADKWLQGAPLPFKPMVPMPWAEVAPGIAGLAAYTDEQALAFLTTGALPGGRQLRPPMPPYRFSAGDARDVLAYLRKPEKPAALAH